MKEYNKGQIGVEFRVQLVDTDNPYNPVPIDLTGYQELKMHFTKPDGSAVEVDAEPADSSNLPDTEIKYLNDNDEQDNLVLDQKGLWSYTASVRYTNQNYIKGLPQRTFWVV